MGGIKNGDKKTNGNDNGIGDDGGTYAGDGVCTNVEIKKCHVKKDYVGGKQLCNPDQYGCREFNVFLQQRICGRGI
jgi:hypothetical protein